MTNIWDSKLQLDDNLRAAGLEVNPAIEDIQLYTGNAIVVYTFLEDGEENSTSTVKTVDIDANLVIEIYTNSSNGETSQKNLGDAYSIVTQVMYEDYNTGTNFITSKKGKFKFAFETEHDNISTMLIPYILRYRERIA